jgi:hypothetical protein
MPCCQVVSLFFTFEIVLTSRHKREIYVKNSQTLTQEISVAKA